jgi:hypothetical protein
MEENLYTTGQRKQSGLEGKGTKMIDRIIYRTKEAHRVILA